MSRSSRYYRSYPSDFRSGTVGLTKEQNSVYRDLIDWMMDRHDAVRGEDGDVARRVRCNARSWQRIRSELQQLGKVHVMPDGGVINRRAVQEMAVTALKLKGKRNAPDVLELERIRALLQFFSESLGELSEKFCKTYPLKDNENRDEDGPDQDQDQDQRKTTSSSSGGPGDDEDRFDEWFDAYPGRAVGDSRSAARKEWDRLTPELRQLAFTAIGPARAHFSKLTKSDPIMRHVFLREHVEAFASLAVPVREVTVPPGEEDPLRPLWQLLTDEGKAAVWNSWLDGQVRCVRDGVITLEHQFDADALTDRIGPLAARLGLRFEAAA